MFTRYLLPIVSAVAFSFAVIQMTKAQQKPPPVSPPVEPARSPYSKSVSGAGIVEPESENIAVGTYVPGIVKSVVVRVGDRVKADELLFELDDRQLLAERDFRTANLAGSREQLRKLEAMPRPEEIPAMEAKVAEMEATLDGNLKLYERAKRAAIASATSQDEVIIRETAVKVSQAQVRKANDDLKLLRAGAWEPDLLVAKATVKQMEMQLQMTRTDLDRLKVTAPRVRRPAAASDRELADFRVLQVNIRPGEFVAAAQGQGYIVLGQVDRLHVRVDIDENDISRFRPGAPGEASPRGNPSQKFPLKFVRVEPFVIPKKSLTGGNTERVDTRVLQVIYAIDLPNPPLYVGQQLDVSLDGG